MARPLALRLPCLGRSCSCLQLSGCALHRSPVPRLDLVCQDLRPSAIRPRVCCPIRPTAPTALAVPTIPPDHTILPI
ncbi:uncharacterized protein BO95DRAFT_443388 [Aspergillus brunneoviolaceus CBS 621.78]|uniref:Uncharacterized protein n=1 Tax=Aspergillus brunneoviolaceus CBS 621.78 TaxID=1450534 RepID=A0ACD1G7Q9_9EURO|nr:hypothetical protein BO95DRAFT_443388 [Aspergillus brunneoviolaceus CBS 621.78]RAH45202.1 hypothetical protein BO95DRAFT_443388 [Aspergillus brunneoviolaceus CBS 621.78]